MREESRSHETHSVNIGHIVAKGELRDFILGTGQFAHGGLDPQAGYDRWNQLEQYYGGLPPDSTTRRNIEEIVVNLLDDPDPRAQYASLTLGRILGIQELASRILALVRCTRFDALSDDTRQELLYAAAVLEIAELSDTIVREMAAWRVLPSFLRWGMAPRDLTPKRNNYWRLEALARYYDERATDEERSVIEDQLRKSCHRYAQLRVLFQELLNQHHDQVSDFSAFLRRECETAGGDIRTER